VTEKQKQRRSWKRGRGAIRKVGRRFYIRYSVNGRRIDEPTDAANETEARRLLNERLGDVSKGTTPVAASRVKLSELYADLKGDYRNKGQDLETLAVRWKHLEPAFGREYAKAITHSRVQAYVDVRREEGAAEQTIKNEIAVLRRMMRLGYEQRKVSQLPLFPTIRPNNVRAVFFEDAEFERLLKALQEVIGEDPSHANEWLVPFVVAARWVGARRNELLPLERRQLDVQTGKVTLDAGTTKNREGRAFFLPAAALAALGEWDARTQALERELGVIVRHVFHRRGRGPIREFPYAVWHAACERAQLPGHRILHDFRRTAARSYRRSGVSEGVVMQILGHKTRSMFERYNIKNEEDLREAARAVAEMGSNGKDGARVVALAPGASKKAE
jgi:integrase